MVAVLAAIGTFIQALISISRLRGTDAAKDFAAFDEWRTEYPTWKFWQARARRTHLEQLKKLRNEQIQAYRQYRLVWWQLASWVILVVAACIGAVVAWPGL